jgi:hypothetical protein
MHNVYNYSLLGGVTAASVMTGDYWLMVAALGVEALWMLYAPDAGFWKRRVDRSIDKAEREAFEAKRIERMNLLPGDLRSRSQALIQKRISIERLAKENPDFQVELLRVEIGKLDRLVDAFIDLCANVDKYQKYLTSEPPLDQLQEQREALLKAATSKKESSDLIRRNLSVLEKRIEHFLGMYAFFERARQQMALLENSFGLMADQIVAMRSPIEFAGQLDELLDGVEAVRETVGETDSWIKESSQVSVRSAS